MNGFERIARGENNYVVDVGIQFQKPSEWDGLIGMVLFWHKTGTGTGAETLKPCVMVHVGHMTHADSFFFLFFFNLSVLVCAIAASTMPIWYRYCTIPLEKKVWVQYSYLKHWRKLL